MILVVIPYALVEGLRVVRQAHHEWLDSNCVDTDARSVGMMKTYKIITMI